MIDINKTNRYYRLSFPFTLKTKEIYTMNKSELISAIAKSADLTKADAGRD
jgi:hypothetical protein